jgi:NAD(P)-dependent dehydrogenase (short-subunit alcohol dehydrogenase family)
MRGAESVSAYEPIAESEKFRIEYWSLEEAKLRRAPPPKPLSGKVALVVGGASGIGRATADRLEREGACVIVADRDESDVVCDITDEASVTALAHEVCLRYGGVDVVVQSAGLSVSRPLVETTAQDWDVQFDVMARGSFLVAREMAKVMIAQGTGGDIVLVVSKNAIAAGPNNAAYGSAKAAQAHLVRLLAAELGSHGIRVNGVNPDAVVRGSQIFAGDWGDDRARTHGVPREELGAFYAKRTLLGAEIVPDDVADAIAVLVGPDLRKTTGTIIPVDGGLPEAFGR